MKGNKQSRREQRARSANRASKSGAAQVETAAATPQLEHTPARASRRVTANTAKTKRRKPYNHKWTMKGNKQSRREQRARRASGTHGDTTARSEALSAPPRATATKQSTGGDPRLRAKPGEALNDRVGTTVKESQPVGTDSSPTPPPGAQPLTDTSATGSDPSPEILSASSPESLMAMLPRPRKTLTTSMATALQTSAAIAIMASAGGDVQPDHTATADTVCRGGSTTPQVDATSATPQPEHGIDEARRRATVKADKPKRRRPYNHRWTMKGNKQSRRDRRRRGVKARGEGPDDNPAAESEAACADARTRQPKAQRAEKETAHDPIEMLSQKLRTTAARPEKDPIGELQQQLSTLAAQKSDATKTAARRRPHSHRWTMPGNKQSRRERRQRRTAASKDTPAAAGHDQAMPASQQPGHLVSPPPKRVQVRPSRVPGAGDGLFALETIYAGEFAARFSGEPLTQEQNARSTSKYRLKVHNNLYLDGSGGQHFEGRSINDPAGTTFRANMRFGSDRRTYTCERTGRIYCRMYATRTIKPDDEMLASYGRLFWHTHRPVTPEASADDDSDGDNDSAEAADGERKGGRHEGRRLNDDDTPRRSGSRGSGDRNRDASGRRDAHEDTGGSSHPEAGPTEHSSSGLDVQRQRADPSQLQPRTSQQSVPEDGGKAVDTTVDRRSLRSRDGEVSVTGRRVGGAIDLTDTASTSEPGCSGDDSSGRRSEHAGGLRSKEESEDGSDVGKATAKVASDASGDGGKYHDERNNASGPGEKCDGVNGAASAMTAATSEDSDDSDGWFHTEFIAGKRVTAPPSPETFTKARAGHPGRPPGGGHQVNVQREGEHTDPQRGIHQRTLGRSQRQTPDKVRVKDTYATSTATVRQAVAIARMQRVQDEHTEQEVHEAMTTAAQVQTPDSYDTSGTEDSGDSDGTGDSNNRNCDLYAYSCHPSPSPLEGLEQDLGTSTARGGPVDEAKQDTEQVEADMRSRHETNDGGSTSGPGSQLEPTSPDDGESNRSNDPNPDSSCEPESEVNHDFGGNRTEAESSTRTTDHTGDNTGVDSDQNPRNPDQDPPDGGISTESGDARGTDTDHTATKVSGTTVPEQPILREREDRDKNRSSEGESAGSASTAKVGHPRFGEREGDNGPDEACNPTGAVDEINCDDTDAAIWQQYLKLAELPAPPSRIPRQHVKEFIKAAERCASTFLRTKTTAALFDILRLPKTVFDPYLTRRKTSTIRAALKDFPRVETPDPHAPDRKKRKKPVHPLTAEARKQANVKAAESLFQEGNLRRAMRRMTSKIKPATITDKVLRRLQELHPQQDTSTMTFTPYSTPPTKPDDEDVMQTMSKINMEASGGPSGWNPRHLKIAMRSPTFFKFITTYAGMMAEGTAPGRLIMTVALGIALEDTTKPNKIRPIDMGETIYKVCVITCYRKNRQFGDLPWYMFGSGTPGGVEPLVYTKRQHLMGYGGWDSNGVIEIDRSNAYNTMSLARVQEALHKHNPKNGPLFEWAYGRPAYTLVRTADGTMRILPTTCIRQGDPPAPFWYQLGDRSDMEALNTNLGDRGTAMSYIDDVTIFKTCTNGEDARDPVMTTVEKSLTSGSFNRKKTQVVSNADARTDGYETLGGFIGPPEKRAAFVRAAARDLAAKMRALNPLKKQTQLVLLRQCVLPTLNHIMRNTNPAGCQQEYKSIRAMIATRIAKLADAPVRLDPSDFRKGYRPLGERVRDTNLISLPMRYGGLGMGDQVVQSTAAWEASQRSSEYYVKKWMTGTTSGPPPDPQRKRMEEYWRQASNQLMNKLYRPQRLRVACNAEKSASAWLTTVPHVPDLLIPDAAVAAGLRSRLLKAQDRLQLTKRKVLRQRMLHELKAANYECKLVTTSTKYTSTDDPTGISDSLVQPMAVSVENFNLSLVSAGDIPEPPPGTSNLLAYYRKMLHRKARRLQRIRFRRHYEGYTHFPFTVTTSGALMGKSEDWIKQLKQRARLDHEPSPITQLISATAVQSMW